MIREMFMSTENYAVEVEYLANAVGHNRIVALHGLTDKIRKTLIFDHLAPLLKSFERTNSSFRFLGGVNMLALSPLTNLSWMLYKFASDDVVHITPTGEPANLNLKEALSGLDWMEFRQKTEEDSEHLVSMIEGLTRKLPETFVFAIMLSDNFFRDSILYRSGKLDTRDEFYKFLSSLSEKECDLRVIVSLPSQNIETLKLKLKNNK